MTTKLIKKYFAKLRLDAKFIHVFFLVQLFCSLSLALELDGSGDQTGVQVLYLFNETTGDILDTSGVGAPLDLEIDNPFNVIRTPGRLTVDSPTLIRSRFSASKIVDQCKISNEFTLEVWLSNREDHPVDRFEPNDAPTTVRIVTISSSQTNRNFTLGEFYDDTGRYSALFASNPNLTSEANVLLPNSATNQAKEIQHVIITKDANGIIRLFVGSQTEKPILRSEVTGAANFDSWNSNMFLGLGNELDYDQPTNGTIDYLLPAEQQAKNRPWRGDFHLLAIYCKALTPFEILGNAAPDQIEFDSVEPMVDDAISANRTKAHEIYSRLAGVKTSIDNAKIIQMEALLDQGNALQAAAIATAENSFYNITVRDLAGRMSTRDESANAPLSDFVSTVIGTVRDNIDARELLYGTYFYHADPQLAAVPTSMVQDILLSNSHYDSLDIGNFDLAKVLVKDNQQLLYNGAGATVVNPDAAGVLTSRGFMQAHAIAGTNRRLVEYSFREFLCIPIDQWADSSAPEKYIGRDVDRFPGGDHLKFTTTCRACHTVMDGLRGAFARVTFSSNYVKNALVIPVGADDDMVGFMQQEPPGIAYKLNQNNDVFPDGYEVLDDSFENFAIQGTNASYFGWSNQIKGNGINDFGRMIANSGAFAECMTRRVYRSVCKREPASFDEEMIRTTASDFRQNGYQLRSLFEKVLITPECIGN